MAPSFYPTIAETLQKFRRKEISPVELVAAHLDRIHQLQPRLNAFVHIDAESARARARDSESRIARGEMLRPLEGIPLTVKSSLDVAGWPCHAGSLLRQDYVPHTNAPLVSRLENAGAILVGNTNTPEFLMAYETDNRLTGKTSNPWNLSYSAGGSSGGEAAAIASGCSMGGVGSDGGGSIRTPAHFCGVCGLKPTPGRIPATGHFPPGVGAFGWIGVVGPMARTVADLRSLFAVMNGPDPGDALSSPVPVREISASDLRGLRIGILENAELGRPTPETLSTLRRATQLLCDLNYRVEPFKLETLDRALELWWFFFGPLIADIFRQSTSGKESQLSPMFLAYLDATQSAPKVTLQSFQEACVDRDLVRASLLHQLRDVPILLSAVSTEPAFKHGAGTYRSGEPHNYRDTMRFSQWLNLAGFPGLSLPLGQSPEGLPINIQLIARPHEEELLLAVAAQVEQARGPWQSPSL
ncbi:MAG TPA: amidase [Candidatus Sulfotelmatobacter sp.]|jgi:Asp-tRNA(Asn)/Glu-tRNA(Gln) amidotransferase A subunit family amidase|nr:amidase [Candidatus Sulfotelmatobacter sp.]